ncbi:MAG: hypothetical protein HYT64_00490 [Candidatus Yanofskybacteria bacterium]|nr:hypothetical protein [Candidatus Yanofskybacteria bacterium]
MSKDLTVQDQKNFSKKFPSLLEYSEESKCIMLLRQLVKDNSKLPVNKQKSRYDLLLSAGYSEHKARALCSILTENGVTIEVPQKGFDVNSAKLVISELAHDENIKPEVRLKAAEDILKVFGVFSEGGGGDGKASEILAQLLHDMFKRSESRPKIIKTALFFFLWLWAGTWPVIRFWPDLKKCPIS